MNPVAEDILNILRHSGVSIKDGAPGRGSGRYPLGSGDNPYQHQGDFLSRVAKLRKEGLTDTEIARGMGISTTKFRAEYSLAKNEKRARDVATAKSLREEGYSLKQIADKMGFANDSSVRTLLNESSEARMNQAQKTAEFLKKQIKEKGMIDVGAGVERELGISREKLNQALELLKNEGYPVYSGGVPQVTNPGKQTILKVICPPGTAHKEIYNFDKIHSASENYVSHDGGDTFDPKFVYPKSMDSSRLKIRYAEDGGIEKDGVIELRRGVDDLSLGESHYAQVRILVDNNRYLKGMAVYSDDMPDGVDVIFNTNKKRGTPKEDVLKKIKNDPDNPFGSLIKEGIVDPDNPTKKKGGQSYYYDKDGNKQLSLINKRSDEGDWGAWSDHLPSQFLSKQNMQLIKKQLNLSLADKQAEYDEICSLTNPTVKKFLLQTFANDCDSAAEHLQAAALPRQKYQVILPITSMKDTEVYAPNYNDGEKVALIRYPHGGTFEIPILTVNNKQKEARKLLGNTPADVVGINSKVAERLSGADFDGDTVMVIPTGGKVNITSTPPLKGLEGFDPKIAYPERKGMKYMKDTQKQMGVVSNLITDMTLKGATQEELARAVRHSMVVIDAEKHKLDYKQSEIDNGIDALRRKYQGRIDENGRYRKGASTLISRAKSEVSVPKRQGSPIINEDGSLSYKTASNLTYVDKKTGKVKERTQPSTAMAETKDAHTLSSGTPQEEAYANYANKMKSLANQARKEMVSTGKIDYSSSAKATYQKEVSSLDAKLKVAQMNAPRERQAQLIANSVVAAKKQDNPDMSKGEIKKAGQQALTKARAEVGAQRHPIDISDREWEAIQSGAISESQLSSILNFADLDDLRERAMPRERTALSTAKVNKIKAMSVSGYTTAEIAKALGVSTSTVSKYLNE